MVELSRRANTDELLQLLKNPYQYQLAQTSVFASLATSIGFTALLGLGFSLLRPYNSVVYAPKLKVADEKHAPPAMGKEIFAWIQPVVKTSEKDLVSLIGLDAVVFLRILAMCRNIFIAIALVGCGILIPINLANGTEKNMKFIVRVTPINTPGEANWGIAICTWIFNFIIAGLLWWNYKAILKMRRDYLESPEYQASLHARTLMLNDIPTNYRSDEGINRLIDKVVPTSSFSRTAIARNVKYLPELIEDHEKIVRKLEKYLAQYMRDPNNLPARRPECYPSQNDPSKDAYPKGRKVDAIEYLTTRMKELEIEIGEVRLAIDNRNPLPYGFASYDDIEECHSIALAAKNKHPHGATIVLSPRPNDIIWKNMPLSKSQRRIRRFINNMWVTLLTILWAAPNALISIFLTTLTNLGHVWKAFQDSLAAHTSWWSIVQGVASPAITSLLYLVLPIIFRRLSIKAGDRTKTARERHVAGKLYTFFVFNFLIVFSMFSTLSNFISTIIDATNSGKDAWKAITDADLGMATFISLCNVSPFWITWLLQRNLGAAIDLIQLWNLIWNTFLRNFSNPTPREMIELTAPQAFDYASQYNCFLFYSTVTLCFAVLQPLVLPACALYFSVDFYLKKYLLLYIFVTKIESGGMFWRMFYNRMVFATILSNLVVFLALWARGDAEHNGAYSILPLLLFMIGFKVYCKKTFDDKFNYFILRNNLRDSEARYTNTFDVKKDKLSSRFGHPALYRPVITPMVHRKAEKLLRHVYGDRSPQFSSPCSNKDVTIPGNSNAIAMSNMQKGASGRKSIISGFEMVPEHQLDFAYYKNHHEFADEHGGGGIAYGRPEDLADSDSCSMFGPGSRPGTPLMQRMDVSSTPVAKSDCLYNNRSERYGFFLDRHDEQCGLINSSKIRDFPSPNLGHGQRPTSLDLRGIPDGDPNLTSNEHLLWSPQGLR